MEEKISHQRFSVALTGGIGSGKSTVGDIFKEHGAFVVDADHIVHELLGPDSPLASAIEEYFGPEVITPQRAIQRHILGDKIFQAPEKRIWLENLIHPLVYERMHQKMLHAPHPYGVALIPLLFESHCENDFDRVLVVDVSEEAQIRRTKERSNYDTDKIRQVMSAQIPRDQRLIQADDVIDNEGSLAALQEQVVLLHEKYLALAKIKEDAWKLL